MKTSSISNNHNANGSFWPMRSLCGMAIAAIGLGASINSAQAVDYVAATGGDSITTYQVGATIYTVHTFTGSGTFTVTSASGGTVNYLVIGGGGGGGGSTGGGGGAGGFLESTATVTGGNTAYTVSVGTGGPGGSGNTAWGTDGNPSAFGSFATAIGGGGGAPNANSGTANGHTGGSGGGGSWVTSASTGGAGTAGQGNKGGDCLAWGGPYVAGGGGGAGAVGVAGNKQNPGANGGAGKASTITGTSTTYAGGGGGGAFNSPGGTGGTGGGGNGGRSPGGTTSGRANTGGGGGGQGSNNAGAAGSGGSGIVIISYASGTSPNPTSTSATLAVSENTATALTESDFGYTDPNSSALTAVQITTLPALGTLKLSGTAVTLNQIVAAADIPNLTYQSALPTYGTGAAYTTIGIKVENGNSLWSAASLMTVNVTPAIIVQDPSFETPGGQSGNWASFKNPPWSSAGSTYSQLKVGPGFDGTFTNLSDGNWVALINNDDCPIATPVYQNLSYSVSAGDRLSVTFAYGRGTSGTPGQGVAYFDVGGTKYTQGFDASVLSAGQWGSTTMTKTITNSGNLTLGFYGNSGHAINVWVDNISDVSVTAMTYSVTYNANSASSGTVPTDSSSPYSAGATVTVKSDSGTLARTGYTFGGWNTATDGSGTYYDATGSATFSMPVNNVTLYAEWTGTVTYDANNATYGAVPTDATAYKQNQSATAASNSGGLARAGYTFVGWNTANDGSGTNYAEGSGSIPMSGGNVTLYAKWTTVPPTITLTGTLSEVNTTYGTASVSPTSFTVSGANMVAGIAVTPPPGFEVSQTPGGASGYAGSGTAITVGSGGTIDATTVYVRLTATDTVGSSPYSGNVTCTSSGAVQMDVATASSTVSPAELIITANHQNKFYDTTQTTPVTGSTAFTSTGLKNGDTVGTVTLTYGTGGLLATDPAGNTSTITPSNAAGGSFTAGNY
ncbi:MAG: InlB B-repeat-containing protein, partial [Verrucomicrobiota bacterium]